MSDEIMEAIERRYEAEERYDRCFEEVEGEE